VKYPLETPSNQEFNDLASEFLGDPRYRRIECFKAHRDWSLLDHSLHVASLAYLWGKKRGDAIDLRSLVRAAFLHDFYFYDWHLPHKGHRLHGFRHPAEALRNAMGIYALNPLERRLIKGHMFPLTFWRLPLSKEARLLIKADHKSALYEHHHPKKEPNRPPFLENILGAAL